MSAQTAERGHAKLVPVNLHAAAGQAGMRYLIYATTLWMLSLSLAHVIRQTTRADALAEMIRARCAARSLREIDPRGTLQCRVPLAKLFILISISMHASGIENSAASAPTIMDAVSTESAISSPHAALPGCVLSCNLSCRT
jgi:hypothetical protein